MRASFPRTIGIAGVGLLGGSIALQARNLEIEVIGYDLDAAALAYAQNHKIIDRAAASFAELAAAADALVLAAPVEGILAGIHELLTLPTDMIERLAWIIDIASVKGPIARAGAALHNFIGTHPMAGRECRGPQAARRDLFNDAPWAVMDTGESAATVAVTAFIQALGARPLLVSPAVHDRIVAATSHVPQLLSSVLCAELDPPAYAGLFGSGLGSMTRLGASPWSMWRSILLTNGPAIGAELRGVSKRLNAVIHALENADEGSLELLFGEAHEKLALLHGETDY